MYIYCALRRIKVRGILAVMCLSVTVLFCVHIAAVAIMFQGATTIYWYVVELQESKA